MFLYPEHVSVNSLADVAPGEYHGVCSVYVDRKTGAKALLSEYWNTSENATSIAELQMVSANEGALGSAIRFIDFVRMPDGSWRDSYGLRADSLGKLIPGEIASYSLFEQVQTGTQIVENNNV